MSDDRTLNLLSQGTEVTAGRVSTLSFEDEDRGAVTGITVTDRPDYGNLTVNPDNTLALVLTGSDHTGPLSLGVSVRYANGDIVEKTAALEVVPGTQDAGWGSGDHYLLQTDDQDRSIIEVGENHRKVHISNDAEALSRADIAAREGVTVSTVTAEWLAEEHPEYGATPDLALDPEIGMELWYGITSLSKAIGAQSNWLLLERGHEYDDLGRLIGRDADGESPLHPMLIGAYGNGDDPVIHSTLRAYQFQSENTVVRDLDFTGGIQAFNLKNFLMENVTISGFGVNAQKTEQFTLRDSEIIDIIREESLSPHFWAGSANRVAGLFAHRSEGLLLEGNFIDHVGWADDYDPAGSLDHGQPPSFYSHNLYIQRNNLDVTVRDNITMRGASFGAQIRSGGFIEDNVFLDNNAAVNFQGNVGEGNYTLFSGNLVTSGAHKRVDRHEGGLTMGVINTAGDSTLTDNIITHLADPNNPAELAWKIVTHGALQNHSAAYFDNTIVYNWAGGQENHKDNSEDRNLEGLDLSRLDQTTIQLFAEQVTGKNGATISDLADLLRAQAQGQLDRFVDADIVLAYFKAAFGIDLAATPHSGTARFVPDDLGDGVRWDNWLNWSTDAVPGDGVRIDLAGNWVQYAGTTNVSGLDLGSQGELTVRQGYLQIDGPLQVGPGGATLEIGLAGQVWTKGYDDPDLLTIDQSGGRFANTGRFDGAIDMTVAAGEAILATGGAIFRLDGTDVLTIEGGAAKVGFDGTGGTATLELAGAATFRFVAHGSTLETVTEFRSGHWGLNEPAVRSVASLSQGTATLALDLTDMGSNALQGELIAVDELTGGFGSIDVSGLASGTGVTVGIDYARDVVTVHASAARAGEPRMQLHLLGSDAKDLFYLGDLGDFVARIGGFDTPDALDVTSLLLAEGVGTAAIEFRRIDSTHTELRVDGSVTQIAHSSRIKSFDIKTDGGRTTISAGTIGTKTADDDGSWNEAGGGGPDVQNRAPDARDGSFSGAANQVLSGSLTATDPDGDALNFSLVSGPDHGSLTLTRNGTFSFTPQNGWSGQDSFTYRVSDGKDADTATVSLGVAASGNQAPVGGNDRFAVQANQILKTGGVLKNDTDGDGDTLQVAAYQTDGTRGTVTYNGDGTFTYDPRDAFALLVNGAKATDSFSYRVSDQNGGFDTVEVIVEVTGTGPNLVRGTDGRDSLTGGSEYDLILGEGGNNDRLWGNGGADIFVFGSEARNGTAEHDFILDYQAGRDSIALTEGARVVSIHGSSSGVIVLLGGDGDAIYVQGDNLAADDLRFLAVEAISPYDWIVG